MKRLTLTFLIVGNLVATEAFAEDVSAQPLTRADCSKAAMTWNDAANVCAANSGSVLNRPLARSECEKAGMSWDENAHVCENASQRAQTITRPAAAVSPGQPLTRKDCDLAGMTWNATANVCAGTSEGSQAASQRTNPVASTILITIDKSSQRMKVSVDGVTQQTWPVSTGASGYDTPSGTFKASSTNEVWYSKQWDNAPMPHAIFFTKDGHAIHGSYATAQLGRAVSHGCVRLAPKNASTLYALVEQQGIENTTIVISGGGQKIAQSHQKKRKPQYSQVDRDRLQLGDAQPQRRCGLFRRRLCGGPYDGGSQGR